MCICNAKFADVVFRGRQRMDGVRNGLRCKSETADLEVDAISSENEIGMRRERVGLSRAPAKSHPWHVRKN